MCDWDTKRNLKHMFFLCVAWGRRGVCKKTVIEIGEKLGWGDSSVVRALAT